MALKPIPEAKPGFIYGRFSSVNFFLKNNNNIIKKYCFIKKKSQY